MALSYTDILADALQILQDTGAATYGSAETTIAMRQALRGVSELYPHIVEETSQVESRTGSATSTSASHLVDATNVQFLSTDVGKYVYNSTDKTWAVITAYTSTSDVTLSKDIMASGETYYIYNAGCYNAKQINVSGVTDRMGVRKVEFPLGTRRNVDSLDDDILTIGIDFDPSDTSETDADKDVYVWYDKHHKLSQLTDFAGAVNNASGYSAGDTSMAINGLQSSGTIEEGQEFTIASTRGKYRTTAAATISTNAATISFLPALESDVANATVVTFVKSTLPVWMEPPFTDYLSGQLAINKSHKLLLEANTAITTLASASTSIGLLTARVTQALADITAGRTETAKLSAIIDLANVEVDKVDAQLTLAIADIASGRALINGFDRKADQYMTTANTEVNSVRGCLESASGYFREAQSREGNNVDYLRQATAQLNVANADVNQGIAYIRKASLELQTAGVAQRLEVWGRNKIQDAKDVIRVHTQELDTTYQEYSRN